MRAIAEKFVNVLLNYLHCSSARGMIKECFKYTRYLFLAGLFQSLYVTGKIDREKEFCRNVEN